MVNETLLWKRASLMPPGVERVRRACAAIAANPDAVQPLVDLARMVGSGAARKGKLLERERAG